MSTRLRVIVREDLSAAQQAVQGMHAQREFAKDHPEVEKLWFDTSNTLALLSLPNEDALCDLMSRALERGIRVSAFREPDIGDRITAICLEPCEAARRLCRGLPSALKGR